MIVGFLVALVVVLCGLLALALQDGVHRTTEEIAWRERYLERLESRVALLEEAGREIPVAT